MIERVGILIAGKLAVFTERSKVKPIAVAVEAILGEIFIIWDIVIGAELAGALPGARFDFD